MQLREQLDLQECGEENDSFRSLETSMLEQQHDVYDDNYGKTYVGGDTKFERRFEKLIEECDAEQLILEIPVKTKFELRKMLTQDELGEFILGKLEVDPDSVLMLNYSSKPRGLSELVLNPGTDVPDSWLGIHKHEGQVLEVSK